MANTNIYVRNLNFSLTEDELRQVFAQFGQVDSVKIIKDKFTGRAKGFGFVEMSNEQEAQTAIDRLNGTDVKGRNIFVDKANPPKAKEA
jgi:RNA recognition motif-containing protein